jgi:sugar (pentulose or hexulose) kinase
VSARVVLTLDLGTSTTKAGLWIDHVLVGPTRAELVTHHPAPGHAQQDPESWWTSVVAACAELRAGAPDRYAAVEVIVCSAARETFALFDADLAPLGSGLLWSDHRAGAEADSLGDADAFRRATGVVRSPGSAVAKALWVARHEPDRFAAARWLLAPRDLVVARLTGTAVTDPSLASRTGWYALDGTPRADAPLRARLPEVVPSTTAIPLRASAWSAALALPLHAVIVPGAGDRACEALGSGARAGAPMVSWGTTANVSVPHPGPVGALPTEAQVSRTGGDGFLVEAGLAAAGSAFDWLAELTGRSVGALWDAAASVPAGAAGVTAFPWFAGARAPHWCPDATAAFAGLRPDHSPAGLARALVEGVAYDIARCLELLDPHGTELVVTGGGAANPTWRAVLGAVSGRTVVVRRHLEAGSVGARLLAAVATGEALDVDTLNPVMTRTAPDPRTTQAYAAHRAAADLQVAALLGAGDGSEHRP